jgi:hypothetical protein
MLADIMVHDTGGNLQLVVEVKNRTDAPIEWISRLRSNLLIHNLVPTSPYFILVLPDYLYLWKHAETSEFQPPDFIASTPAVIRLQMNQFATLLDNIAEYGLELLIVSWLGRVMDAQLDPESVPDELKWLFDSGLYQAIKHGTIAVGATVA